MPVVDTFNFVKNSGKEVASTRLLALNRYTPGRSLSVSALQSDEAIFREVLARLEEADAPYGRNGQIIRPVAIPLPEDIAESADISAKKYLLFGDIDGSVVRNDEEVTETNLIGKVLSGERREWSRWGTMCPVSAPKTFKEIFPAQRCIRTLFISCPVKKT